MKDKPLQGGYSKEELETMLRNMEGASDVFYALAQGTNFHQFLEFNGFIRQYIVCCREALAKGIDFATTAQLPMVDHQAAYIGEKFECIFGESFARKEDLIRAFCQSAFGVDVTVR
jgi:hypothetical protein